MTDRWCAVLGQNAQDERSGVTFGLATDSRGEGGRPFSWPVNAMAQIGSAIDGDVVETGFCQFFQEHRGKLGHRNTAHPRRESCSSVDSLWTFSLRNSRSDQENVPLLEPCL